MDEQLCTIPAAFVPLSYMNDPETEEVMFGDQLSESMVVLIESALLREDPDNFETATPLGKAQIRQTSQWSRVVGIRKRGGMHTFICEYADGSKCSRRYGSSYPWIVKKASMPD